MYYVITDYTFDADVKLRTFNTLTDAQNFLRSDFISEVRFEMEENDRVLGDDLTVNIDKEGYYASININGDVTSWNLSTPELWDEKPVKEFTLYLYNKDQDRYDVFESSPDVQLVLNKGRAISAIIKNDDARDINGEPYDWAEIRDDKENTIWVSWIDM